MARLAVTAAEPRLALVPAFKPAYLIHGDDHGRIGERRAKLRALAEPESRRRRRRGASRATPRRPTPSPPRSAR